MLAWLGFGCDGVGIGVFWCIVLHFGISIFVFIDFYIIFACLSMYVLLVFSFTVFVSRFVCLLICLVVSFRFYSLFVFIYCSCYVTVLYHFFLESICCSKMRLSYSVFLLIYCTYIVFLKICRNIVCIIQWNYIWNNSVHIYNFYINQLYFAICLTIIIVSTMHTLFLVMLVQKWHRQKLRSWIHF